MDRTSLFRSYLGESDVSPDSLQKITSPFNESASAISRLILSIGDSIDEHSEAFIDKYESFLARKSAMSDEQREVFVGQITSSISNAESLIAQLAEKINSGKIRFQGDALDFSAEVFRALDHRLARVRQQFAALRAAREKIKMRFSPNLSRSTHLQIERPELPKIPEPFAQSLALEHQTVLDELLSDHARVIRVETAGEELATLQRIYNELVAAQTETIRVIRGNMEGAAVDYEEGADTLNVVADRTKWRHFWISMIIIILGLMLLWGQFKEGLKRM
jgi:methyl-accepting chemotaxis protein